MDTLGEVVRDLQRALAAILESPIKGFFDVLGKAVGRVAEGWEYFGNVLKTQLLPILQPLIDKIGEITGGFDITKFIDLWQGGLVIAIRLVAGALELVVPVIVKVLDTLAAIGNNPVFQALIAPLKAVIENLLSARGEITEFQEQSKGSRDALKGVNDEAKELPENIISSKDAAKELKEQQQAVTDAIKESGAAIDANATASQAIADQQSSVTQAYLKAEMQINGVLLDQLKNQLNGAKTQAERVAVARDIYKLTVQQANLEYEATKAQIAAEVEKAHLALMATEQKAKEVQLIVELATAQGHVNESHYKSLQLANESVNLASVQAGTTQLIATQQERAAKAVLQGKINAAGAAFQTNILAKNTNEAANQSERFAAGFQKAAAAVSGMSQNALTKKIYGSTTTTTTRANVAPTASAQQIVRAAASGFKAFAKGGVVTKPTLGLIGEAGTEYIVPESKAADFATNYLSGASGASSKSMSAGRAPTINITTGPVMQQNGQNWVTVPDMERALATLADTMLLNNRTPGGRRYQGVN
jgi:septal ring factor EnvC (AmiA/AmiB activator)